MRAANGTLLSVGQVAEVCEVSPGTVRNWVDRDGLIGHLLPGKRRRRHRRILRKDLRAFLAQKRMPVPESLQVDAGGV